MESMSIGIIDMLAAYNCMLCSTPFLHIADYKHAAKQR